MTTRRRHIEVTDYEDRAERMLADPDAYFAEARRRAREMVQRDMERQAALRRQQRVERLKRAAWLWWR